MIAIIGAMEEEVASLKSMMHRQSEQTIANCHFIQGKLENKDIILLQSGIGKVNAAMATTILLATYKPTVVINTGSAGGFADDLEVGDIVISDEVVHHDVDVTAFDYEYGQVPSMPPRFKADERLIKKVKDVNDTLHLKSRIGLIATGDSFMSDPERVTEIRQRFPDMLAAEMEAVAIAQVCYQYEIPFVVIRALSDIAGKKSEISFDEFLDTAARNASNFIVEFLKTY